jgi:hypothetical protein
MGNIFKRYINKKENKVDTEDNTNTQIPPKNLNESKTSESPKGFFGLAKNLTKSLIEWQQAGRPVVNSEQWKSRITICRGCEFWQEVGESQIARCKKCGCSSGKLLLSTSRCPLNPPKWTSV